MAAVVVSVASGCEIALDGSLDGRSVADVRATLHAAIDAGFGDLFVDVSRVDLVDLTGLGVLVGADRRAKLAGRRVVLRDASLNIYADTADEKFFPPETLARMVAAGDLGRKTGQGFYRHED